MAVHGCISPKFVDNVEDDDDDGPICFRRNSSSAQHSQSNSSFKSSPANQNPSLVKSPHAQISPNGENAYSRKSKTINSSKTSQVDLASISKKSALSGQQKVAMNNISFKAAGSEDSDDDMPLSCRHSTAPTGHDKHSKPPAPKSMPEVGTSDESDDDKPLSFRISTSGSGASKNKSIPEKKLTSFSRPIPSVSVSMNDHKPSSSKSSSKHSFGFITDESFGSDEDHKPLAARFQQNGSSNNGLQSAGKLLSGSAKRPSTDADKSSLASNKKPKYEGLNENKVKEEQSDEDDNDDDHLPLSQRLNSVSVSADKSSLASNKKPKYEDHNENKVKQEQFDEDDNDDDHLPLSHRLNSVSVSKSHSSEKKVLKKVISKPFKNKFNKKKDKASDSKYSKFSKVPPGSGGGKKWTTLEHNGVIFPPAYKPHGVKMLYDGKPVDLTPEQEEVATMFAVMKDTDYAAKTTFITNFWNDWKKILGENHVIEDFERCDFTPIYEWHLREKEKKKQMSSVEKNALKEEKLNQEEKYMWALVDGVKEKVGNFRVEPPGLFRGRGEHPKMGKLKKRIYPHDITINIGKGAPIPECPIPGERWKEIKHDNTVTWLAFWMDPINSKEFKYVFLAASSSLKGQSDKEKYEKARKLKDYIQSIRANYTKDFTSKNDSTRQIAVATYLIDKLALRAGNEKDDDEADTVGCCTLKVENVALVPPNKIQFDFLGKDSIRYFNTVDVEPAVYKAIGDFCNGKGRNGGPKNGSEDLFDKLDTSKLNGHLKGLMPGLTAKVFRTYNASITLDQMLNKETNDGTVQEKIAVYQTANKEVAIICNHQRSVSKTHDAQMSRLNERIEELKARRDELKVDLSRARKGKPPLKDAEGKPKRNMAPEMLEKKLAQVDTKIEKMELDKKIKDDLKTVALGTSKINYLDPRITVAWCKRYEVPIEKIFNKSLIAKFAWAMDVDPSFRF